MTEVFIVYTRAMPEYDEAWLCAERRAKLARLRNDKAVRQSLAAELSLIRAVRTFYPNAPLPLRYERNEHGKPYLCDYPQLKINISHSGDYTVCAAGDRELGIDIQKVGSPRPGIAKRFFTEDECEYIESDKLKFYEIWAKKESYLKAKGTGMDVPLNSFSVFQAEDCAFTRLDAPEPGYVMWLCELKLRS